MDVRTLPGVWTRPTGVAVVIDVLRATTTTAALLDAGASYVRPVGSVDEARARRDAGQCELLAGEREGLRPEGFDLGNSPAEIPSDLVRGRGVVLATTNGTVALAAVRGWASVVLTLSLTNLDAVADALEGLGMDAVLVCSGTDRQRSVEDELAAGLLVDRLREWRRSRPADEIRDDALGLVSRSGGIREAIETSPHAERLHGLGFGQDVAFCARVSVTPCVPRMDPERSVLIRG